MASAIVNNAGLVGPEGFLDPPTSAVPCSSYGWLSPRVSFSHEFSGDVKPQVPPASHVGGSLGNDAYLDFEFVLVDDPVAMLPADELFSDGKLVPRQLTAVRPALEAPAASSQVAAPPSAGVIPAPAPEKTPQMAEEPCAAFSPKAPTCTSRWRDLLWLRKSAQSVGATRPGAQKSSSKCSSSSSASAVVCTGSNGASAARSLKHLPPQESMPSPSSVDPYSDSVRIPSCPSLPSSAPDHDHPRLSLDADRPGDVSISHGRNPARLRLAPRASPTADPSSARSHQSGRAGRPPTRRSSDEVTARSASVDSPRMNSSGKVVFQGLGRSSSSPSALHGGPKGKSHPASVVRVAPVLNVPVSVFGLGHLFSALQRKDSAAGSSSSGTARSSSGGSGSSSVGKPERA